MAQQQPNKFLESMKQASQRFSSAVMDTGAKTMLKTDMVFLERDIKARKHAFGIQIYDILSMNNASTSTSEIQKAYEECQRDISELENKVRSKREEMEAIASGSGGTGNVNVNSTEAEFGAVQSP
eukprot:scaffold52326_cov54-Cyclotella_meneghiniana.AAC.1